MRWQIESFGDNNSPNTAPKGVVCVLCIEPIL